MPEAQTALRRAISIDPNFAQALNNLGIVHFDLRKFEEAAEFYEQAIKANSTYPEAHNNLGNALRALGKQEEALEQYQRALLLRERYPEAYNNLAAILRDRDQIAEAEHAYRKAMSCPASALIGQNRRDDEGRIFWLIVISGSPSEMRRPWTIRLSSRKRFERGPTATSRRKKSPQPGKEEPEVRAAARMAPQGD